MSHTTLPDEFGDGVVQSASTYHCGQIIMIARILAGDDWETITIPRGGSATFNEAVWGKGHFR